MGSEDHFMEEMKIFSFELLGGLRNEGFKRLGFCSSKEYCLIKKCRMFT